MHLQESELWYNFCYEMWILIDDFIFVFTIIYAFSIAFWSASQQQFCWYVSNSDSATKLVKALDTKKKYIYGHIFKVGTQLVHIQQFGKNHTF